MAAKWFAIKTLYRSTTKDRPEKPDLYYDPDATLVEERILLIKAPHRSEAIAKAEREAKDYARTAVCENLYNQKITTYYMGYVDVYEIPENPANKVEVFSAIRIMSCKVSDKKIAHVYIGKRERHFAKSKRRKFINKNYSAEE